MMGMLWVVLFVALTGSHIGYGSPIRTTPQTYPRDTNPPVYEGWGTEGGLYAAVPALALVLTAVGLLFGCTWCYRHKDCKLFTASATHLHSAQRIHPPDSGFSEPANNNISEDNNNGPISLREMQNIANNNAAAYIVSENEERNRISRESVVEFEPLPTGLRVADPLEHCADWFGFEDFNRNQLQYLREIGRGWFGRVVEGEIEDAGSTTTVAVKILNQNASLEDKARFLDEAKMYRDVRHENVITFIAKCLQEDPWILIFEFCSMDLQQYLVVNRPKMAILNESGVPLRLMCDVTSALTYLHSRGYMYGNLWSGNVLVQNAIENPRAVLGQYTNIEPQHDISAPELRRNGSYTTSSEIWSLGTLVWEVCTWGATPTRHPPPPDLPCPYRNHLYQVMQLCWNHNPEARPTAAQVQALLEHLMTTQAATDKDTPDQSADFEERWQRLKPNTIPKIDEHVAIVHAPSTSIASHFTGSDRDLDTVHQIHDTLSIDMDTAVSRSSSIMSDKDPLSIQIKSESLTNLHGSLEDVRNIYLTHNETPALECHQGNIGLEEAREHDRSDGSVDPWLKDIIAGSQDDVSYYRDVSDVIKNLDNILNSEKTSSSESSHQASPSRDNLSLDCKKDYPMQSSLVKSPGISNFQNIIDAGFGAKVDETEPCDDDEVDRDTIGTLSHSFERHSDTVSQQTLENLTPDTPMQDLEVACIVESQIATVEENRGTLDKVADNEVSKSLHENIELPKDNTLVDRDKKVPKLKELCVASIPNENVTNIEQMFARKDCEVPCDSNLTELRSDNKEETKSVGNIEQLSTSSEDIKELQNINDKLVQHTETTCDKNIILPRTRTLNKIESSVEEHKVEDDTATEVNQIESLEDKKLIDVVTDCYSDSGTSEKNLGSDLVEVENNFLVESIPVESVNYQINESIAAENTDDVKREMSPIKGDIFNDANTKETEHVECVSVSIEQTPDAVQNEIDMKSSIEPTENIKTDDQEFDLKSTITDINIMPDLPPETVQNNDKNETCVSEEKVDNIIENDVIEEKENIARSETYVENDIIEQSNDSTVYMDLINNTNSEVVKNNLVDNNVTEVIDTHLGTSPTKNVSLDKTESTVYLDLPSFEVIKQTDDFLHMERLTNSQNVEHDICSSTPITSDKSNKNAEESTLEDSKENETLLCDTKLPDYGPGVSFTKLEQKYVPDNLSPFESPTKSHHTDTYDENSSVVLGPFENCSLELFRPVKSNIEAIELPKEELLAFSSNFSEINLETPSPLRDGNFLNEVPDIIQDDVQFDDIGSIEESKPNQSEPQTENVTEDSGQVATEKRISPSTPPNSPGIFLASTSQEKYLVNIDLGNDQAPDSDSNSLQKEIELNQIELQITSKLAMAENENNLNIEYSGPLTVEGLEIEEEAIIQESDAIPESYLAGNGGSVEDVRVELSLDEECVKALRNELELKLPLAQVAAIEPQCDSEWSSELPPPPELIVSYPGALSPIAEETRQQLSAYENDMNWNTSVRTDSSESYPEPCNNSTDDATDLPTAAHAPHEAPHTYTILSAEHSQNNTYTINKDSREITMSADSLNASPHKIPKDETQSPIDDRTYNKNDDEKETNCERISQVSPFLVSPTTDTSDNATGVSTLSKTTLPTDAKHSKPSETQCLSKATSIDSWCSNDTLYNVEENFDDLAMDPDLPLDFEPVRDEGHSESTDTLTHNDDEKEASHCSTYIIHDSKSDACETFSPDSITANDNYTYTKAKTDAAGTTPSVITKSDVNDSTKNTQTKDLAYGTLMSGMPSYSNCTTEVVSGFDDAWKLPQPEMVRRSPIGDEINITPPQNIESKDVEESSSPQLESEPCFKKMDSVEISCLQDNLADSHEVSNSEAQNLLIEINDSPQYNYKNMAPSVTSTPIIETGADSENTVAIPMQLPQVTTENTTECIVNVPNFQTFQQSAEVRPQDLSSNVSNECNTQDTEALLEAESKTLSRNSNRDSLIMSERTPTYSDFESSAISKPQDVNSRDKSSQSMESGISSEEFRQFESSVRNRPQDLSSLIDASSLLLKSERMSSDLAMISSVNIEQDLTNLSESRVSCNEPMQSLDVSPPNVTNLIESQELVNFREPANTFLINFDMEEETEQPHSIIITEAPMDVFKDSPNKTYDSHTERKIVDLNFTYDSHPSRCSSLQNSTTQQPKVNGEVNVVGDLITLNEHKPLSLVESESILDIPVTPENVDVREHVSTSSEVTLPKPVHESSVEVKCNGNSQNYATVNFLNENFEELIESNVDEGDNKEESTQEENSTKSIASPIEDKTINTAKESVSNTKEICSGEKLVKPNGVTEIDDRMTSVTQDFLKNEQNFCQLDQYFPLLSDIRFSGPATEIMSTSFTQDSPTEPTSPECEQDNKTDTAAEILKEWDSDSESHSSNSSSGEFIWKQRGSGGGGSASGPEGGEHLSEGGDASDASGDSGSGSEGDEVEFVPSSWDCRAAPAKSSLRSLEQAPPDSKKRVVFKRQKYHCVYEYPREVADIDAHSPAYLPDLSTYSEWEPSSAEEAELCYGQLFASPALPLGYPLRAGIAFGPDYDEDFFISSSARPFESLGIMSTTSQFFPGMHVKNSLLERDLSDDVVDEFPPPPSPLPTTTLAQSRTPSLDFTTPDSGVEDITPGSTTDEEYKAKKLPENELTWKPVDSGSSSESVSPSSPGGEMLGGLRHTRDKLKLDLPPSPHVPSPRHSRVFNFVLDKPKRRPEERADAGGTPLVMTDDTPVVATALPLHKDDEPPAPEPTFSTFGKSAQKIEPEQKIILTDDVEPAAEVKDDGPKAVEAVKGEGTVLDSGDEDSGIESSSKATLERNKAPNVS